MNAKRKWKGGTWVLIGFLLSPLSWWNDLFVNVPLALVFAWAVSWVHAPLFTASFIVGYWLTNVLGFVLMHKGAKVVWAEQSASSPRKEIAKGLVISFIYTLLIVALVKLKWIEPLPNYFPKQ